MAHRFLAYSAAGIAGLLVAGCLEPLTCERIRTCPVPPDAGTGTPDAGDARPEFDSAPQVSASTSAASTAAVPTVSAGLDSGDPDAATGGGGLDSSMAPDAAGNTGAETDTGTVSSELDASLDVDGGGQSHRDACAANCSADGSVVDVCAVCSVNATCNPTPGAQTCTCKAGWWGNGTTCEQPPSCEGLAATCGADRGHRRQFHPGGPQR
jgi:EGF domain